MARNLTAKQKKAIEKYHAKTLSVIFDEQTEDEIANMNMYENVSSDMDRYLWDIHSEYKSKHRDF